MNGIPRRFEDAALHEVLHVTAVRRALAVPGAENRHESRTAVEPRTMALLNIAASALFSNEAPPGGRRIAA